MFAVPIDQILHHIVVLLADIVLNGLSGRTEFHLIRNPTVSFAVNHDVALAIRSEAYEADALRSNEYVLLLLWFRELSFSSLAECN